MARLRQVEELQEEAKKVNKGSKVEINARSAEIELDQEDKSPKRSKMIYKEKQFSEDKREKVRSKPTNVESAVQSAKETEKG